MFLIATRVLVTLVAMAFAGIVNGRELLITEFMTHRSLAVRDEDGGPFDVIEVDNPGPYWRAVPGVP